MERTQWARVVDVSVPGTKLRWRHNYWRRRVAGKEVTLVTEEVHRVHDPSGPPSSAALSYPVQ
jgi:hypothetical protein